MIAISVVEREAAHPVIEHMTTFEVYEGDVLITTSRLDTGYFSRRKMTRAEWDQVVEFVNGEIADFELVERERHAANE